MRQAWLSVLLFPLLVLLCTPAAAQTVDPAFNPNAQGQVADGRVLALALHPDGRILIGGDFTTIGGIAHRSLARLNADGSLDPSFTATANGSVFALAVQRDGKILVGGQFNGIGQSVTDETRHHRALARLDPDGTVDSSFAPNPISLISSSCCSPTAGFSRQDPSIKRPLPGRSHATA